MTDRYIVFEKSQSGHCCFQATVVDMLRPEYNDSSGKLLWYNSVCECFEIDDANRIAAALNAAVGPLYGPESFRIEDPIVSKTDDSFYRAEMQVGWTRDGLNWRSGSMADFNADIAINGPIP